MRDALAPHCDVPGYPASEERPPGPLSRATGMPHDVREIIGTGRPADVANGGTQLLRGEGASARVRTVHANRSVAVVAAGNSFSSAILMRIASSARFSRDLAVPTGIPSAAAVSGRVRSR